MPVQIGDVQADVDVRPPDAAAAPGGATMRSVDRAELERLRPMVLQILRDELDRLRRQQG